MADVLTHVPSDKKKGRVFHNISERKLLIHLKELCCQCGWENPRQYKLHSFRHHFASLCANHGVAHRKILAWLGHSSSEMLDLYYHLHDQDSQQAMMELAQSDAASLTNESSPPEDNLRARGESKTENKPQDPDIQELMAYFVKNFPKTERAGFNLPLRFYLHSGYPQLYTNIAKSNT